MKRLSMLVVLMAAVARGAAAQVGAPPVDEEGLPVPAPPEESPAAPPETPPPPPRDQQAAPAPLASAGQWVYTQQYGWLWMPYGDAYAYVPPDGRGEPYAYVYYPYAAVGWTWVVAPWIWGWGPWPYFGVYGPYHYAWYHHAWWRGPFHPMTPIPRHFAGAPAPHLAWRGAMVPHPAIGVRPGVGHVVSGHVAGGHGGGHGGGGHGGGHR